MRVQIGSTFMLYGTVSQSLLPNFDSIETAELQVMIIVIGRYISQERPLICMDIFVFVRN